ncbi:hypothetical protein CDAR_394911 [Caerostris darwini]|uniref:Uncharacterized protein n=1 Tax=Caerostris darwini TaxID=1538125 RepID=A0AAV4RSD2_9ARAC|nr:hypothetical protein CDAR_394911 [Caerostris darwini]
MEVRNGTPCYQRISARAIWKPLNGSHRDSIEEGLPPLSTSFRISNIDPHLFHNSLIPILLVFKPPEPSQQTYFMYFSNEKKRSNILVREPRKWQNGVIIPPFLPRARRFPNRCLRLLSSENAAFMSVPVASDARLCMHKQKIMFLTPAHVVGKRVVLFTESPPENGKYCLAGKKGVFCVINLGSCFAMKF